jgi:hypothetical protein
MNPAAPPNMQAPRNLTPAAILKRLQPLCGKTEDAPQLVDELKKLLVQDFDEVFSVLRTHKLVNQGRSLKTIQFVSREVTGWLPSAPFSGKKKGQLRKHLTVCEFVQTAFDEIDASTQELGIWSASSDLFFRTILGFVEYQSATSGEKVRDLVKKIPDLAANPDKNLLQQRMLHDRLRDVSDGACLILRQFSLRHTEPSQPCLDASQINRAFQLANRTDFVQRFFDNYSYLNWQAKISGNTISFRAPHPDWILLDYYCQQLIHAGDQFDSLTEIALRQSIRPPDDRNEPGADYGSKPFAEFFLSADGQKALEKGSRVAVELMKKIRKRILEVFDESEELHTPDGRFTIRELVQTWGFLNSVAHCVASWTALKIRTNRGEALSNFAPVIAKSELKARLSDELKISEDHADALLSQFTIHKRRDNDWDLFFRPLIEVAENNLGLGSTFIESSRFYRNVFSIAIRDSSLDLSPRGFKPLVALREKFVKADVKVGVNRSVRKEGRDLTDVDLFFFKDQILFVAQVKVLLDPDSPYETWKVMTKLNRAADQLQSTMDALPSIKADLFNELGLLEKERNQEAQNFPFILCNIEHATGLRIKGFPVVHFGLLEMLLRGGRIGLLAVESGSINPIGFRQLIRGERPTGVEFKSLINDPRPYFNTMFKRPHIRQFNFCSGSFVVQVPACTVALRG